jgi:hypothetical protein
LIGQTEKGPAAVRLWGLFRVFGGRAVVVRRSGPLTPALSRGRGSLFVCFLRLEFDSIFQVGVTCKNTTVSPLSLWERARVRAFKR